MNEPKSYYTHTAVHPLLGEVTADAETLRALDDLRLVVASEAEALKHCFIFTFAARNHILRALGNLKQNMAPIRCDLMREVMSLMEIITMMCTRPNVYKDREGMEHIQQALHLIEDFITSASLSSKQQQQAADTIEDLWRWIDISVY